MSTGGEATVDARRWSALPLSKDAGRPVDGSVCATIWPTRSLNSSNRWFDELHLWTEGFQASTTQRACIQSGALEAALQMLERECADRIAVTLSFGTVERFLDDVAGAFDDHALVSHRVAVLLRGSFDRLRSRYRIRALCEHLRALHTPIGYLLTAASISTEQKALDLLRPDFAKLHAPGSMRIELWEDLLLEAQVAGVPYESLIVAGLDTHQGLEVARQLGVEFGQGRAVQPAFAPPALWADELQRPGGRGEIDPENARRYWPITRRT
jgi:hypothetical protein